MTFKRSIVIFMQNINMLDIIMIPKKMIKEIVCVENTLLVTFDPFLANRFYLTPLRLNVTYIDHS